MTQRAMTMEESESSVRKQYSLFGAQIEIVLLDTSGHAAETVMDEAYALGVRLQRVFNIYDDQSEISHLNRERTLRASPEFLHVLRLALDLCQRTKGAYDISRGKQFLQRKRGAVVMPVESSYHDVKIEGRIVRLPHPDAWLDLGSIAKGYIAERMVAYLQAQGATAGYVDARGDLRFFGDPIVVGVQHPRQLGNLCSIRVSNVGVATSGDYQQYHQDYDESHLLNKKEIISATVIAEDLTIADAYATILMVCDTPTRDRLLKGTLLKAMTVDKSLHVHYYNGFDTLVVP